MRRRVALVVPGLLVFVGVVTLWLLLTLPGHGDAVVMYVYCATVARMVLSGAWIWLSDTFQRAICVSGLLLGVEALSSLYLLNPWRRPGTEIQEWAQLPVLMGNFALGPALLVLLALYLVAFQVARRRALNSR